MSDLDPVAEAMALLDALPCAVRKPWGSEIEPICGAEIRVYVGARCVAYVCRYTDDMEGAAADLIVAAPRLLAALSGTAGRALSDEVERLRRVEAAAKKAASRLAALWDDEVRGGTIGDRVARLALADLREALK